MGTRQIDEAAADRVRVHVLDDDCLIPTRYKHSSWFAFLSKSCILLQPRTDPHTATTTYVSAAMFAAFGNFIGQPLSWMAGAVFGQPPSSASLGPDAVGPGDHVEPFEPGIADVLVVRAMLNGAFALPPELLNTILDLAEYWPHTTTEWSGGPLSIYGGRPSREDVFLVNNRSGPRSLW